MLARRPSTCSVCCGHRTDAGTSGRGEHRRNGARRDSSEVLCRVETAVKEDADELIGSDGGPTFMDGEGAFEGDFLTALR